MLDSLALLEKDFTEFQEFTMARLSEHCLSQQLRDEVCPVKREQDRCDQAVNTEITKGCATLPSMHLVHHPILGP
ncbi:hypothetical protein AAFF_G00290880 [Aldrovandia affinis]|uniref:Uncharacterized protein n=1 Tax=Aldrovandia affinis TaxID=143900 RepID=A0AAD7W1D2_9TELE|nr:hypothetical protein AAFF_G00290880 [Aldrovandia affinis]